MSKEKKQLKNISKQSNLMQRILEVRYTDMEEEKNLCKQLLELSEREQYYFGSAFANVYLMDSHLALGEYSSCDFYLVRAKFLCKEYGFDDLMMMLCNCAGLYYQKLNDDLTAISYFLEGKKIADKLGNIAMEAKLYNNIGYSFAKNGDLETAGTYFQRAFRTVENNFEGENIRNAVSYLSNLAEACRYMGDAKGGREALELCEKLSDDNVYTRIRMGSSWCSYYVEIGEYEKSKSIVDQLVKSDLLEVEEHFFVCDMAMGLCGNMLTLGDKKRTNLLLEIIENLEYRTSLFLHYKIHCLKIRCWEKFNETEKLKEAYKEYYEIAIKVNQIEDQTKTQSMCSKIQINEAVLEREAMQEEMQVLQNVSQLDELTGLYNRRYFNKLVSKMIHRHDLKRLGIIMLDVDYFKQYNDFYGHFKGDSALRTVGQALIENAKEGIHVSRYGGDEFVCLCVNLEDEEVEKYANQVIKAIEKENIIHEKNTDTGILTLSLGYCNEQFDAIIDSQEILNMADQALYEVKQSKRGYGMRKRL